MDDELSVDLQSQDSPFRGIVPVLDRVGESIQTIGDVGPSIPVPSMQFDQSGVIFFSERASINLRSHPLQVALRTLPRRSVWHPLSDELPHVRLLRIKNHVPAIIQPNIKLALGPVREIQQRGSEKLTC